MAINLDTLHSQLVAYRRELHMYPEISMKEYETTKKIKAWLEKENIEILNFDLDVGVVAEIKGKEPGPTIALRADIDALPIDEKTNLPFSSKVKNTMHACGHDFHTASMIGAAILLNQRKNELKGNVRFIFQPGEELSTGAKYVVNKGVLENVEAIFGMHNKPDLPVGTIGVRNGALMASVDRFEIEIVGIGGHAGIPNKVVDPILISGHLITALQSVVSRTVSPFDNVVISITKVEAGNTWNVIPERATLEGTVRTFQKDVREKIPQLMERVVEGITSSFGAKSIFKWYPYVSTINNSPIFTDVVKETALQLGYEVVEAKPSPAGEDFAHYQELIPGYFIWMGVDGEFDWHHPSFTLNEDALIVASNYFSTLAINVLQKLNK